MKPIATTPPHVSVQIYVTGGSVEGWIVFDPRPRRARTDRFAEQLGHELGVFHSWVRSLKEQTPRARAFHVEGVRLVWQHAGADGAPVLEVLAAFCPSEERAFEPWLGQELEGRAHPAQKRRRKK